MGGKGSTNLSFTNDMDELIGKQKDLLTVYPHLIPNHLSFLEYLSEEKCHISPLIIPAIIGKEFSDHFAYKSFYKVNFGIEGRDYEYHLTQKISIHFNNYKDFFPDVLLYLDNSRISTVRLSVDLESNLNQLRKLCIEEIPHTYLSCLFSTHENGYRGSADLL